MLMERLREGRRTLPAAPPTSCVRRVARVRDAGASGQLTMRADSCFYNHAVVAACRALMSRTSVTIRQQPNVRTPPIEAIPGLDARSRTGCRARAVAETTYTPFQHTGDATACSLRCCA